MKNEEIGISSKPRIRVAFFQRIFAHYQAGLLKELAQNSRHEYHFFGDDRDPMKSGIELIPPALFSRVAFNLCRTIALGKLSFQWRSVYEALFGDFDTYILEGSYAIATNWLAIPAARIRGKRVLLYSHGWLRRESGCKAWFRNCFYRMSHGLLLYGNRSRQIGVGFGFAPEQLYVVNNSLDLDNIDIFRRAVSEEKCLKFRDDWFHSNASKPVIVSVGRLTSVKKFPLLLDAAAILKCQGIDCTVMLVGDGPDTALLKNMAERLGVRLILPGARYDEEFLSVCFSAADITVIPGAAGLTVIHSLSYGTPVIVNDDSDRQMPESEAVQDGINGALFSSENAEDLARSIVMVLHKLPRTPLVADKCRLIVDTAYTPSRMRMFFDDAVSAYPAMFY